MDIEEFKSYLRYGVAKPHSYNVKIRGASGLLAQEIGIMAEEAEIPGKSFATGNTALFGPQVKFPYLAIYNDFRVVFICSSDMWERKWFEDWHNRIENPKSGYFAYPDDYTSDIHIEQLNGRGEQVYEGVAKKAWPVTIDPQPLGYGMTNTYHRLAVTFAYFRFLDLDVEDTLSGDSGVFGTTLPARGGGGGLPTPKPPVPQ